MGAEQLLLPLGLPQGPFVAHSQPLSASLLGARLARISSRVGICPLQGLARFLGSPGSSFTAPWQERRCLPTPSVCLPFYLGSCGCQVRLLECPGSSPFVFGGPGFLLALRERVVLLECGVPDLWHCCCLPLSSPPLHLPQSSFLHLFVPTALLNEVLPSLRGGLPASEERTPELRRTQGFLSGLLSWRAGRIPPAVRPFPPTHFHALRKKERTTTGEAYLSSPVDAFPF